MSDTNSPLSLNNLEMSDKAKPLLNAVIKHIRENVDPMTEEYHRLGEGRENRWSYHPKQLELMALLKMLSSKLMVVVQQLLLLAF